tara:strand:- start:228 stop:548 length:321 start_codon:yes stop_codon:yes gene_type:complete
MHISEKLKLLRALFNLTQQDIAEKLFISQKAYAKYEADSNSIPEHRLNQLLKLYNITIKQFESFDREYLLNKMKQVGEEDSLLLIEVLERKIYLLEIEIENLKKSN